MDNNLLEEVKKHFNEPILTHKLGRVIGYSEDDRDAYIIILYLGGKIIHHTLVGGYYYLDRLKGQNYVKAYNGEDWDDFVRLDGLLENNKSPKQKEFLIKILNEIKNHE